MHNHFRTWKFRVVASTEPHRVSRSTETINTSAAPTEFVRPASSTRPLALSLLPLAAPVILIVKSSVASAHPFGRSERQEATAATSPATPTMDAGNWPGGPENLSSNGSSIVTCPGTTDVMVIGEFLNKPKSRDEGLHFRFIDVRLRVRHLVRSLNRLSKILVDYRLRVAAIG